MRARWVGGVPPAFLLILALGGCNPPLPEAESPGAQLYASRCSGCHRLYAPATMTGEMWKFQVERMQGELVRRGLQPLSPGERDTLLAYLQRHGT
jgi:hypothetical protein